MSVDDPRGELAQLTAAFRAQLAWHERRGAVGIAAVPSPRRSPLPPPSAPRLPGAPVDEVAPRPDRGDATARLAVVRNDLGDCQRCGLAGGRTNIVFGVGSPNADLMFVGEAPGRDEDRQGEPFVGAAGQLLTRMIKAMGLLREEVYIANIIKCRPPSNRDPEPDELAQCEPFLIAQIGAIQPRIIVSLGNFATKALLRTKTGIMRLRGNWREYHDIPLMPTCHPAYLLRNASDKRLVWSDLQAVMGEMDDKNLFRRRERVRLPST